MGITVLSFEISLLSSVVFKLHALSASVQSCHLKFIIRDEIGIRKTIFLTSPQTHTLWVLIGKWVLMGTHTICLLGNIRTIITTFLLKKRALSRIVKFWNF